MIMRYLYALLITLAACMSATAQTKVRGTVTDGETGEPLPFVSIVFKGTSVGTISDVDGNFFIQGHVDADTLEFSMMGYTPYYYKVNKESFQEINVVMDADSYELNEIVVHPGENPAWRIMRNVAANRKKNDPDRLDSYKFEVYNKMEVDINNIRDDFTDRGILRNFNFTEHFSQDDRVSMLHTAESSCQAPACSPAAVAHGQCPPLYRAALPCGISMR